VAKDKALSVFFQGKNQSTLFKKETKQRKGFDPGSNPGGGIFNLSRFP